MGTTTSHLSKETEAFVEKEKTLLAGANARQGQLPTKRLSRDELQRNFRKLEYKIQKQPLKRGEMRLTFTGEAYPPCVLQIDQLKPISINDLRLETHHRGRFICLRAFSEPVQLADIQSAVEDETGAVERLSIYNTDPRLPLGDLLPRDGVVLVKEPYYKMTTDCYPLIRVDHPSDLMTLAAGHALVPSQWRSQQKMTNRGTDLSALARHTAQAHQEHDSFRTLELCTALIEACPGQMNPGVAAVFGMRSQANFELQRHTAAHADATSAIMPNPTGEEENASNARAYFWAGQAKYAMGQYRDAAKLFQSSIHIGVQVEDVTDKEAFADTITRIKEEEKGGLDITDLKRAWMYHQTSRIDAASYVKNTMVKGTQSMGRGLFATKDIQAGEIILVERALVISCMSDSSSKMEVAYNANMGRKSAGLHRSLLTAVMNLIEDSPERGKQILDLYDGGYPHVPLQSDTRPAPLDTFRIQAIIEHNAFGGDDVRYDLESHRLGADLSQVKPSSTLGIWPRASLINHDCIGNAQYALMGNIMVVRATRDIAKDEQIFQPYQSPSTVDVGISHGQIKHRWRFDCKCVVCSAHFNPAGRAQHVVQALTKAHNWPAFIGSGHPMFSDKTVQMISGDIILQEVEAAYEDAVFPFGVPRVGYMVVGARLLGAYKSLAMWDQIVDVGTRLLRGLGFRITPKPQPARLVRNNCVFTREVLDMVGYVEFAHAKTNSIRELAIFRQLSLEMFKVYHVDGEGWEHWEVRCS